MKRRFTNLFLVCVLALSMISMPTWALDSNNENKETQNETDQIVTEKPSNDSVEEKTEKIIEEDKVDSKIEDTPEVSQLEATADVTEETIVEQESQPIASGKIQIIPSSESIEVGRIAQYQIYITLDGSIKEYTNVQVKIALPGMVKSNYVDFSQNLDELKIKGVAPSYNQEENILVYNFSKLNGGFETSILLKLNTVNGSPVNGSALTINASLTADEMTASNAEASTALVANMNASVSNKIKGILVDGEIVDRLSIKYLDETVFAVGASVNKYVSGSLQLQEGSKVVISYTLADGIAYISDTSGVTPTVVGNTYTWEFDASSNEDDDYYFVQNFNIITKIEGDLTLFSKVKNSATYEFTYVDGTEKTFKADATVVVSPNFDYVLPDQLVGFPYSSIFSGPSDDRGNVGWINNDDISVTDGAILGWNFYLTPLEATTSTHKNNTYNVFFHPDENLNFRNMYSGDF